MEELGKGIRQATHIPVLVRAFDLSGGDVLELGTGYFSTPILRWLCEMGRRKLYSYDKSNFWYQKALAKPAPFHEVIKVDNWDKIEIERPWGLVLVDHSPDERRWVEIKRLANWAEYIIIHDSNLSKFKNYGYEKIWSLFKYRFNYNKISPNTTVVSNFNSLEKFQ